MPYKDRDKKLAYDRERNKRLTDEQRERKYASTTEWWSTPSGKYSAQKYQAERRGVKWQITFDEWFSIWEVSGKWDERGSDGYCMCRKGDVGPYHKDNVYIALASQNKQDAWFNNKIALPNTGLYYKDLK